ncbi:MAG: flagellar hook-length control protein FliK, partial [Bacillota bacterium]
ENAHTSAKVGRDEPALNGSPRWADAPVTELSTAPRTPEQPEGTHMAMDEMNDSTVGRVGSAVDRPPADKALVRESVTVSTERPAGGRARTAPQVESENAHTSAKVGRDEPALNGSPRWADAPVTELSTAPRAPERQTAWPEGRTMVLPDGSAPVTPETLTTVATEEPMAIEPEQPAGTHVAMDQMNDSTAGQGARATGGPPVDQMPVRESVTVSTERPVGGRVRTAPQVEPQNALTSAKVERDEPGSMGMPTAEHGMAPDMVDVAHGETAKTEMAQARQTAVRPTAPRREGAMTASRAVTVSRDWPEALVRSALVESLARRESEPNARPELAVVVGPIEGPDVSHTPQAARPALTEPAGWSVTRQIAAHVSARAAQGGGEFRARLVPEHLGSVQIRVRVVRGVCTADIRADDAEIARYIESHSSDLKVSLAEHGIDLSGLSVSSRSRAQEGWGVATLSHSESDWSAPSWNGANARQQYAAATFAGGNWRDGRGERRGAMMGSGAGMANPHSAVRQSGSPSPDEPIAARWARGFARIDYLA